MGSWVRSSVASIALASLALASAPSIAQQALNGDPTHGKAISYTCLGCHGIPGYRNAYPNYSVPKLEGQHPEYIVAALQGYKSGDRPHTTMHSQASSLSDQDMADIAVFFAGKPLEGRAPGAAPAAGAPTPPQAAAACVACHGTDGVGTTVMFPTLSGQHLDYLEKALRDYRSGARKNIVMDQMAAHESDTDIDVIAHYYSKLTPSLQTLERPYTSLSAGR